MSSIARILRVSSWAQRVFEFGPQSTRDEALCFISQCNMRIARLEFERGFSCIPAREREGVEDFLDLAAMNMLAFCLENLILAPPGVHKRLMRLKEYRSRVPWMRAF